MLGVMLAEYLIPWDAYAQDLSMAQQPPSAGHLLGTDRYGRDMLARVLVGGRTSIWGALVVVLLITAIGAVIGTGSGWYGGRIEQAWMGLSDVFLAFPGLVLALAVAGVSGGGMLQAILALAAIGWPKYARLSRRLTASLKGEPYIDIARMRGISSWKIMGGHILPNMAG
ncbi:MAG: ABC transporter permease, partial [Dialister sp.]|nr:ABC transporter permease [Dialister sp.]MDY2621604.1 ABC transporter permease [Dialister sp.]